MPRFLTEDDALTTDVLERWMQKAKAQVEDIGAWRDDPAERSWHSDRPKLPHNFFTDTSFLINWISTRLPNLDPTPLQKIYAAIIAWNEDHNASRIADQLSLNATLDAAQFVLGAAWADIECRLVREDGGHLIPRLLESSEPPRLFADDVGKLRAFLKKPFGASRLMSETQAAENRRKLEEILRYNDELRATPSSDQGEAADSGESERFIFAEAGGVYFISGLGESGHVPMLEGFKILYRLVRSIGTPVLMAELEGTETDDRMKADKRSKQPALDTPYFRQVYDELAELRRDLEQANQDGNVAEAERLQSRIEATNESLAASMGRRGGKSKARDLNNPLDQARSRLHRNLKTARGKLKQSKPPMEKLAEHFKQTISSEGAAFVYHPGFPVKWHSTLPDPRGKQRM